MQDQNFVRYVTTQDVIVKFQIKPLASEYRQHLNNYLLSRFLQEYEDFDMSFETIERSNGGVSYIEEIAFNFGNFQKFSNDCFAKVSYHLEVFGEEFLTEIEVTANS